MTEAKNLFEALLNEIERVARKHERWLRMIEEMPEMGGGMKIGAAIMQTEIENAKSALATMDPTAMLGPLESLRGYDSND